MLVKGPVGIVVFVVPHYERYEGLIRPTNTGN
jgi:hypothetical protein